MAGPRLPLLHRLAEGKRVLAVDQPLSTQPGKPALYRIADSKLRFYLAALRQAEELVRRARAEAALRLVHRRWHSWRGKAVAPIVREALELAAVTGALPWSEVEAVGGWWNRRFDPEVDLVGADRRPGAGRVHFTGSITWLATPFDRHDLAAHHAAAVQVPGYDDGRTGTVVVSLSGADLPADSPVDVTWGPGDVVGAWRTGL